MKKIFYLMLILQIGTTALFSDMNTKGTSSIFKFNNIYNPYSKLKKITNIIIDSSTNNSFLINEFIPGQKNLIFLFKNGNLYKLISEHTSGQITTIADSAIARAPQWCRARLKLNFSMMDSITQGKWANIIINCEPRYRDEVSFCVGYLSQEYLNSKFGNPDLIIDNAKFIYENDKYLDYVRVVDYGDPNFDNDYYSTVIYKTALGPDTNEVEVPKNIYYWYIVYPEVTDEIAAYIKPDMSEDNWSHSNNITDKEHGEFWREFLFYKQDRGYVNLKDVLKDCKVVWDKTTGEIGTFDNYAIAKIDKWTSSILEFNSDYERPHQPVRIYKKHKGRCGEHSDFRNAAARTALIPCLSVATYSTDHVWNEFWDNNEWIHWDGGNINNPYMYEDGWGKILGSVFQIRSDGTPTSVSNKYSHTKGKIKIFVVDKNNKPVDGANVILYIKDGSYKMFDNYGITDNNGMIEFIVGIQRAYFAKAITPIGNYPSNDDYKFIASSLMPNQTVICTLAVNSSVNDTPRNELYSTTSSSNSGSYFVQINCESPYYLKYGIDFLNDLGRNIGQYVMRFNKDSIKSNINIFITDKENYENFLNGKEFKVYSKIEKASKTTLGFEIPDTTKEWYVIINNPNIANYQYINGDINLYSVKSDSIKKIEILTAYPNPFKKSITFSVKNPLKKKANISIYDITGRHIKTVYNNTLYAGKFNYTWEGCDDDNKRVSSGIYIIVFKAGNNAVAKKITFLK